MRLPKKKYLLTFILTVVVLYCFMNYGFLHSNHNQNDIAPLNPFNRDGNIVPINPNNNINKINNNNNNNVHNDNNSKDDVVNPVNNNDHKNNEIKEVPPVVENNNNNNNNNNNVNQERKFIVAFDNGGFGAVSSGITKCAGDIEIEVTGDYTKERTADVSYYHMQAPTKGAPGAKPNYVMVYTMESEPHSYGGESWDNADFRMWYNLDLSFPEPATYFDVKAHLADLLSPPHVEFNDKTDEAPIAWIVSNCNAFNGREKYLGKLMQILKIDSYGGCLKNKFTHTSDRMKGNIELFSRYKFVIAIENSNCEDYVTEKLVHAVASGSIPIVAGKDNKPNYLKFMPKHSYINIYDYSSQEQLANHIKMIASNKTLYESYFPFKRHTYSKDYLKKLSLSELIELAKKIMGPQETFFSEIVAKEKSENKLCKIARYILNTKPEVIRQQIEAKKMKRPSTQDACLAPSNLDALANMKSNVDAKVVPAAAEIPAAQPRIEGIVEVDVHNATIRPAK